MQETLAKPGAGLPFLESLYVRYYVGPFLSRKADKDTNLRLFTLIGKRLLKEIAEIDPAKRDQKVLVPRMKGIEDSSRNWCANEVLEHLMITGEGMRGLVIELANGRTSTYEVKIENFKPKGKYQGEEAAKDFKKFLDETGALLKELRIADEGPTHKHPWMGMFNALQWTWLLAGHSGLHLAQLQAIKKGL